MKPINEFLSELLDLGIDLWVEGDRLRYKAPEGTLTSALRAEISERKEEIIKDLKQDNLNSNIASQSSSQSIVPISRDRDLPLSFGQQRLWFVNQLDKNSTVYNESLSLKIEGVLQIEPLERALQEIWIRHEVLRTTFSIVNGSPVQIINPSQNLPLQVIDLQALDKQAQWAEVERLANQQDQSIFNLECDRLLRLTLIKLAENCHVLSLTIHHLIADGSFMSIFIKEFTTLYEAFSQNKSSPLPKLSVQYADYAYWQRQRLQGEFLEHHINYWKKQLAEAPAYLELPTDRLRPPIQTFQGQGEQFQLDAQLTQKLKQLSQKSGVTLFMTLLSAFSILLNRYTNQKDIVIGSPIANRNSTELEGLLGFFVNNLILRIQLQQNLSFTELLHQVRQISLDAFEHSEAPFEKIVDELEIGRNLSYHPLFQVAFVLQNTPMWKLFQNSPDGKLTLAGLDLTLINPDKFKAKFDLTLEIFEQDQRLNGIFVYNTDLFNTSTIERMASHFLTLLNEIINDPEQKISDLVLMTAKERQQLLVEWNDTKREYPHLKCIHELFEVQVMQNPDALAIEFAGQQLTYRELNAQANQTAHYLQKLGIKPNELIGICVERSLKMIVGILGILKAGGAYVPIDPTYPQERITFMLSDAQVELLLTQENLLRALPEHQVQTILLDTDWELIEKESVNNLEINVDSDSLAYVIYTSGSTGTPKGVLVSHQAVTRLVINTDYIQWESCDRIAQVSNTSFDAATFEIWGALLNGAQLIGISKETALSPKLLAEQLRTKKITVMFLTTALFNQIVSKVENAFQTLRYLLFGGESVDPQTVMKVVAKGAPQHLLHVYGPTENTTFSCWYLVQQVAENATTIPIGKPIANTQAYILDANLQPVPIGVAGELYVGGDGIAKGYLNRQELTDEKFILNPFRKERANKLYKTGDLVKYLPDGNIEFLGRIDFQVKIRGFRVELGEVEAILAQHPDVQECFVLAREDRPKFKSLVAYLTIATETLTNRQLRSFLKERLPDYMIPSAFVILDSFPLTPNGKVDRRLLLAPSQELLGESESFIAPHTQTEKVISEIWSTLLGVEKVSIYDNFFDIGGHSLLLIQVHSKLQEAFTQPISIVDLFQYPTIHALAQYLNQDQDEESRKIDKSCDRTRAYNTIEPIAIIGMSGRFPGAKNVDEFWQNLCDGVESISFFSDQEVIDSGVDPDLVKNPNYVKASATLADIELFDANFFGFSAREAEIMDPQHRLFLESAWEAVENAGYNTENCNLPIGVFAGVGLNCYWLKNLASNPDLAKVTSDYQIFLGNGKDFAATRVSYKLNLRGPSVNVSTACSTSLVAVQMACQSLLNHECHMALAGGVSIQIPQKLGYLHEIGMILSPDGHCRAFDAQAQGTVSGSGVGIVVLKRLSDAIADGDFIHATIRSAAINNDGSMKVGYTAPSVEGQSGVISEAQSLVDIDPETITYIEAHGTGTTLGDPIEIAALTKAFRVGTQKTGFCAIGSLKTNVGHLDTAAGVAGLIKTALALSHKQIPPSLHFEQPNPKIDFANSPFYVNTELREWASSDTPRRAGVSSFGIGGTNAHAILEEAPEREESSDSIRPYHLILLSAKTEAALEASTSNLRDHFQQHPQLNLADVCYTLQIGRQEFSHRRMLICQNTEELIQTLDSPESLRSLSQTHTNNPRSVVFMFSGQGSQYVTMAQELYDREPIFRQYVDQCCDLLKPHLGLDLAQILYPSADQKESATETLQQTAITQPALFTIEYALSQLWMIWGIIPQAMIGHSIGEYVAACLAGVFPLEDALALVATRGRLMQQLPSGSMLAVPLSEAEILPLLGQELSIAAINAPEMCVVSGSQTAIAILEKQLQAQGHECRFLHTSHAFHSRMMEPILEEFMQEVQRIELHPPQKPYISNVTGKWIESADATDPSYWANHIRQTVRFSEGLQNFLQDPNYILLEVGAGQTLSSLARRHPDRLPEQTVLASLRHPQNPQTDMYCLLSTLGKLWLEGISINWSAFYAQERRLRLPLPTYPFERQRYWIETSGTKATNQALSESLDKKPDIADWFYIPSWKRSVITSDRKDAAVALTNCLVFLDECGLGDQLIKKLQQTYKNVVIVKAGAEFAHLEDSVYSLNPLRSQDYETLFTELQAQNKFPHKILHLWTVTETDPECSELDWATQSQYLGFYSLLFIAKAIGRLNSTDKLQLDIISSNMQDVAGEDLKYPEKATIVGALKVIPQEYPYIRCRSIDVVLPAVDTPQEHQLIDQLIVELATLSTEPVIAYRGNHRWLQTFEPFRLEAASTTSKLHSGGVYLITGGLGGIGLALAEYLSKSVQAKLILTSRSEFPACDRWDSWLANHPDCDRTSQTIQKLQALEELGSEILVVSADVADRSQMQFAVTQSIARFGQINGLIHCAGVPSGGIIQQKTLESIEQVMRSKISGTLVLEQIFKDMPLDFTILCSSLSSILGIFGQADYCAANAYLDAFTHSRALRWNAPLTCINWDTWQEVGMAVNPNVPADLLTSYLEILQQGMLTQEAIDVFSRILDQTLPQVLISTRDLQSRIKNHKPLQVSAPLSSLAISTHTRPQLITVYAAPEKELEHAIANIWQQLLGVSPIGLHDNFFELGGHSLLATQVASRMRQAFQVELPLNYLFEQPTILGLAEYVETSRWNSQVLAPEAGLSNSDREEGEI